MMHRRSLLSWLGVSAAGALDPLSANEAPPPAGKPVVALESFQAADSDHMPRIHAYLSGAVLPSMNEIHRHPAVCLEAIVAPHTPQALLLAAFANFDEMLATRERLAAHPRIQQARADLESANVLTEVRSQVLLGTAQFPRFFDSGIFELRSYHAPGWHEGTPPRLTAILDRAGIRPIVNASTAAGEHLPRFTYLIPFDSLAAREAAWSRLEADPDWVTLQREAAAKVTGKSIYKLAPYSRLA
jgi:hypothetical protein